MEEPKSWSFGIVPTGTALGGERLLVGPLSTPVADEPDMIYFVLRAIQVHRQTS